MRKFMKKTTVILTVAMMSVMLAACGSKEGTDSGESLIETQPIEEEQTEENTAEGSEEAAGAEDTASEETQEENTETKADASEEAAADETTEAQTEENQEPAEEESSEAQSESGNEQNYEDNFAVDSEAVVAFAEKVQAAVAEKNLEALADLTGYPVYVGFTDGGVGVNTRDEFIELGADKIFTQELLDSVAGADIENLSPSMAGFTVTKDGAPNVIFGVRDGKLTINGINY